MKYIYNKVRILIISKNHKSFFSMRLVLGVILGGLFGFLYYLLTNLTSHPPAIASTPWFTTFYGIILGGMLSKS